MNGNGIYTNFNTQIIEVGVWLFGKKHGKFILTNQNGVESVHEWYLGKRYNCTIKKNHNSLQKSFMESEKSSQETVKQFFRIMH